VDQIINPEGWGGFGISIAASSTDLLVGAIAAESFHGAAWVYELIAPSPTVGVTFPSLISYNGVPGIYGGSSPSTGTVTLPSPAPAGGTTVDLESDSFWLQVPLTVWVPEGATTATFAITPWNVFSDMTVVVTARSGSMSGTGTVTVLKNKVVKVIGTTINSLGTGLAEVRLAVPTQDDFTVDLISFDYNLVGVPMTVVVPAGKITAKFLVTSNNPVSTQTDVYITAGPAWGDKSTKVTVRPEVQVNSVGFYDSFILAGTQTQGFVFLQGNAPAGGQVVALSSNRSAVTVPASVTVPAGEMYGYFDVTSSGSANVAATITAKNTDGVKRTGTINVVRPRLASVSLSQSTAKGGSEFPTVTVSLTQAVPFDVTISLSSNQRTVASVPEFITIRAGQVSASGEVTTFKPGKDKTVVISARYQADSSKQVGLKVTK
jgi:hypothetical protein